MVTLSAFCRRPVLHFFISNTNHLSSSIVSRTFHLLPLHYTEHHKYMVIKKDFFYCVSSIVAIPGLTELVP